MYYSMGLKFHPHPTPPTWTAFLNLFYCLNKKQTKKVKRAKWADKLKKKKTKFKIYSSLSLSLSLSGTPSSWPVGRPSSPDSVSTGRHLSLSRPYFIGDKHTLSLSLSLLSPASRSSLPARTFPPTQLATSL
jgi:hypothetical protein